jgi:hypothetical protein
MKTLGEIRPVKKDAEANLLKKAGVTGVDIGYKYVDGKKTDVLSIRVYVKEKRDAKDVSKKEMIPKTIKGIKTDVIEREFVLHPLMVRVADLAIRADTGTYDPLVGGISIGPCRSVYIPQADVACTGSPGPGWYVFVGTLGAIVTDNDSGDEMLLSNFHVMCVDDGWSVGDEMAQPSRVDGGNCPADVVGELQRASLGGQVDCAVASHTARDFSCEIEEIGDVAGVATASEGMAVRKRGRTTGLTYGIVDTVDLTVQIDYCNGLGPITLTDQIGIDVDPAQSAQFGDSGDSGSVVVNGEREVVGLYFAGDSTGTYGVANPIEAVLDALDVSICVPKGKEIEKKWEVKEAKWEVKEIEKKYEAKEIEKKWEVKEIEKKRELKDYKDKEKDIYERFPTERIPPWPRDPLEKRLADLEAAVSGMTRFAPSAMRKDCIDFRTVPPGSGPNPRAVGALMFEVYDHAGNLRPQTQVQSWGGLTGLNCGFRVEIGVSEPCPSVELTLVHFAQPATVQAYNVDGMLAGTAAMSGPQGVAETLTLMGTAIRQVVIVAPQDETLLLQFCCIGEKPPKEQKECKEKEGKEKPEKEIKETKPERWEKGDFKDTKPEKWEKGEGKDFKEKPEKWEKGDGKDFKEKPEKREKMEKWEYDGRIRPIEPIQPVPGGTLEERLTRLESAVAQVTHFIRPELRPDLSRGALKREPDHRQR